MQLLFAIHANHLKSINITKRKRTNNVLLWSPLSLKLFFALSFVLIVNNLLLLLTIESLM